MAYREGENVSYREQNSSDAETQGLWSRFLNYSASCLKADLISGLVPVNSKRWTSIADNFENVVSQGTRLLMLDADIERLVPRLMPTQSLQYGWPLVALESRDGLKVAPLFVMDIAPPPYPANSIAVFGDPVINPAVVRSLLSAAGDVNFLRTQVGEGMPEGNVAIQRYVEDICAVLGLPHQDLDVFDLQKGIPQEQGVYNSAVVIIVESLPTARPIVEELRQLADRTDWHETAASLIMGVEHAPVIGHDNMPVMPWSTDEAFEEGLQMVRKNNVTVFNMTQRDVIDQMYGSIACNAWNDGESVLIVTDNEKRQGELAKLSRDINDCMLLRTGCDLDFEMNPTRQGWQLSKLAKVMIPNIEATAPSLHTVLERVEKEVGRAEELRRIALTGAKRRDELIKEKTELENKRLEMAKHIWRNGVVSGDFEVTELGNEIKNLQRTWFCAKFRTAALLRRINAKKNVTIEEVFDWCMLVLAIKKLDEELNSLRDPDKYNVSAANYRWASTGIGQVSARVSMSISQGKEQLTNLEQTRAHDLQTQRAVSDAVSVLRCWTSDYETANAFFRLKPALFDIIVLDNAHRYSLAQVLPLLYRARRVVIVGDVNAAAHVVFLDDEQLASLANRYQFERDIMIERCLDYSVGNAYAALSHL